MDIDVEQIEKRLRTHLNVLTREIGERSIDFPRNIERAAAYIEDFYSTLDLPVRHEACRYGDLRADNVITEVRLSDRPSKRYLLGAHYDSARGTVGADDNASAVAVQLETIRCLKELHRTEGLDLAVKSVSFTLEERGGILTTCRGSRVHARRARRSREKIDGMLCLEMVGCTSHQPRCQRYPFPLNFMNYPREGNFIGVIGNFRSRRFTRALCSAFQQNPELPVVGLTVPLNGWLLPPVRRSDHAPFWDNGFKAVMITDTAEFRNLHYHKASDTMDKLDYRFMAELIRSLLLFFSAAHGE